MKVSPEEPFEIVYSLYEHEYLGFLFESFAIQLNDKGNLTYLHQNISSKNAVEFDSKLDQADYKIIKLMDEIQQEHLANYFQKKKLKPGLFFLTTYHELNGDKALQHEINNYVERRRSQILALIGGKNLYEMGKDGEPAWKKINISETQASILFHFRKNEDNTHYFPTIKLNDEKVEFRQNGSYLLCKEPGWMVANDTLFTFEKNVSGGKIKPFLNKKFILVQKDMEETYYRKFVAPLIAEFDVYAKGFEIRTEKPNPQPKLTLSDVHTARATTLFDDDAKAVTPESDKVLLELSFNYGDYNFQADRLNRVSVSMEKNDGEYIFHRVSRDTEQEKSIIQKLDECGLALKNSRLTLSKAKAFDWLSNQKEMLANFELHQIQNGKKYFLGESTLDLEVTEGVDWFDLQAKIKFGEFEIPFSVVREHILKEKTEIKLPNGEFGVIPESWIIRYKDLFAFTNHDNGGVKLDKIHLSLVRELKEGDLAKVTVSRKLEQLLDFEKIEEFETPESFKGELRPYQLAGYNWLRFLEEY
ncbi:MAG: ATP-dependent helicase, partial [Cyclobacteriaceae bacterium]